MSSCGDIVKAGIAKMAIRTITTAVAAIPAIALSLSLLFFFVSVGAEAALPTFAPQVPQKGIPSLNEAPHLGQNFVVGVCLITPVCLAAAVFGFLP